MTRFIVVALVVVSAYLVFEYGRINAGYDIVEAGNISQAYEDRIMQLEDNIIELKQEVASLGALQAKIQEQRDAIGFYRGIVSPSDGNSGLRVQDLKFTQGKSEREFNVRLVLVQAMKHDRKVSGDVNLRFIGDQNGTEMTYAFTQLVPEDADQSWPFSFRYFQDFDRQLVLPDGFTPERITVEVRSRTRSISSIEESFVWATSQG